MSKKKQRLFGTILVMGLWLLLAAGLWFGPRQELSAW